MSIYKKLNEFKKTVGGVKKNASNPFHKNKYATIESVLETIEAPLNEVGLGFVQCVEDMFLITTIYSDDDERTITSKIPLILTKNDMQQLGSAITYARRYALVSMFGLEQEDDDGNRASGYTRNKQQQQNISIDRVKELANVKQIPLENICKGYNLQTLEHATSQELNKIYEQLLKK